MHDDIQEKLEAIGMQRLAEILTEFAVISEEGGRLLQILRSTEDESIERIKEEIDAVRDSREYIPNHGIYAFCTSQELLLLEIKTAVQDPLTGLQLVAAFFDTDRVINRASDDWNSIQVIFSESASELFVHYARLVEDKESVVDVLLKVSMNDEFGVRRDLFAKVAECLPETTLRKLSDRLKDMASQSKRYDSYFIAHAKQVLAEQLNDVEAYEKSLRDSKGQLDDYALTKLARMHLENDNPDMAYELLMKVGRSNSIRREVVEELLEKVYRARGNQEELTVLLWEKLDIRPTRENLQTLLEVIGDSQREAVIEKLLGRIAANPLFNELHVDFMLENGRITEAEQYLIERANALDGEDYYSLGSFAQAMQDADKPLAASILYRSLLLSILEDGKSNAYKYGAKYLRTLDQLAEDVEEWKPFVSHEVLKAELKQLHGRKWLFWNTYEAKSDEDGQRKSRGRISRYRNS